ncbi:hypothetical protein F4677DRAFT_408649 [Hypoxylon crocopeplum]|nr:hypothetical protein F4677DRAFT_408649 [Hypoxylon crocopeplum]
MSLLRDSTAGALIRAVTRGRVLKYPEDANFKLPPKYLISSSASSADAIEKRHNGLASSYLEAGGRSEEHVDNTQRAKGITRVTWYSDNDPENPQNWPALKKS